VKLSDIFGGGSDRPKVCPSCGALVGSKGARCYQCGASTTFSIAAASKSLARLLPSASPATYGILTLCCVLFVVSLLATLRDTGTLFPEGAGLLDIGSISGGVLQRLGWSEPLPYNLEEPWRFVTAVFLHGSILHIAFNMWVLMDIGPQIEELYGSARYFFVFMLSGAGGYALSSFFQKTSVGASGALLGLIGVMLAMTMGSRSAGMQLLRGQLIRWLIYIALLGFVFRGIDNYAHLGGFIVGFVLGKILAPRPPQTAEERKRAYAMGWLAALAVAASFIMAAITRFKQP
jgi:membrane associated rhomboid family serine protease